MAALNGNQGGLGYGNNMPNPLPGPVPGNVPGNIPNLQPGGMMGGMGMGGSNAPSNAQGGGNGKGGPPGANLFVYHIPVTESNFPKQGLRFRELRQPHVGIGCHHWHEWHAGEVALLPLAVLGVTVEQIDGKRLKVELKKNKPTPY
eukprot:752736-Hanusia_phi.AAC.3